MVGKGYGVYYIELELGLMARYYASTNQVHLKTGYKSSFGILAIDPQKDLVSVVPADLFKQYNIEFSVGTIAEGIVSSVSHFGVFVSIGNRPGLIHKSVFKDFSLERGDLVEGSTVKVRIISISKKGLNLAIPYDL